MDIWLRTRLTSAICTAGRLAPGRQQAPQAIPLTSDIKKLSGSTKRIKTGIKWDPILLFILAAYSLNTKSLCQLALPLRRVVSMYMFLFFWSVPLDYFMLAWGSRRSSSGLYLSNDPYSMCSKCFKLQLHKHWGVNWVWQGMTAAMPWFQKENKLNLLLILLFMNNIIHWRYGNMPRVLVHVCAWGLHSLCVIRLDMLFTHYAVFNRLVEILIRYMIN